MLFLLTELIGIFTTSIYRFQSKDRRMAKKIQALKSVPGNKAKEDLCEFKLFPIVMTI